MRARFTRPRRDFRRFPSSARNYAAAIWVIRRRGIKRTLRQMRRDGEHHSRGPLELIFPGRFQGLGYQSGDGVGCTVWGN